MGTTSGTVLIAGAGPTGMTAALELARFGIPVRLVEKAPGPATTSRAIGVQPRTLELFDRRGLADRLVPLGNSARATTAYGGGERLFRLEFGHVDSRFNFVLIVSQAETERVLREALEVAGVRIDWGVTLIALAQAERGVDVTAVLQHPDGTLEQASGRYLIDAEGAHSVARQTLDIPFAGMSLPDDYSLGDLTVDGDLPETDLHVFSSDHGFLAMFPMGHRRFRLIASNPPGAASEDAPPTLEALQGDYDQRSHIPARFHDLTWSSWFRINSRMIRRLHVGRVFFGGDSAHIHSPAGAQGMNTGIQDMINLSWKLAMVLQGRARPELLETYAADRLPVIESVLGRTEGLTHAIGSRNALFRSAFNHLAPWITSPEFVRHEAAEQMTQLAVQYRHGPLSTSDGHSGSLAPGDRMPNLAVTVLEAAGPAATPPVPATVHELLDPSRFTLLAGHLADPSKTLAEVRDAIDPWHDLIRVHHLAPPEGDGAAFDRSFGPLPSLFLVRPDGYIAFAGTGASVPELARYCERWLLPLSSR